MEKINLGPMILSQPDTAYWRLGGPVARAWHIGKNFKPGKA